MMETGSANGREIWRKFLRRHRTMLVLFAAGAILVLIGAILVALWFVGDAQSSGLVPRTLGLWTMGSLVTFLLRLIFWEFLLVGIPTILAAVAAWQWWKRLPDEEKKEYHFFDRRSRATGRGGSISLLVLVAFSIKVFADGNWNVAFATWTFDYLVYSWLSALIWVLVIIGIPAGLGIIWWINRAVKKRP
jgi:hypothetical protein